MVKCISQKKVYETQLLAEEALIQAHIQFEYRPGTGPVTIYKCDDCGFYHFTSKGTMNAALDAFLKGKQSERSREAERWGKKFKGR